ncbi:type II toxin-antitoxin system RelE/ParE family toxin, partial [Riemerella anatipestifer]|uniref:type II toxin-antitoxin system RelE/ParE family toxin n=1 Tax=Riemerella anatipestifer TaxID=34085 RepID=UPI0028557913
SKNNILIFSLINNSCFFHFIMHNGLYRIFCCFDKGNLVVLFNGFQKKTQKTPTKEIIKAEKIMEEYFNEQKEDKNGNKK